MREFFVILKQTPVTICYYISYAFGVPLDLKATCDTRLILNIYIRLKIKPNSVRIRSLS